MTLTLLLIRHATARPALEGEADEDRPLAPEGREEARRMGAWIAARRLVPAEALCSAARRTRETLDRMAAAWSPAPRALLVPELYAAGPEETLERLTASGAASGAASVALVGHNPTVGLLAERLAREPWRGGFPPGTVAALRFEAASWEGIEGGEVVAWATPEEMARGAGMAR